MRIIYDDILEFAEVRVRCEHTRNKSMCKYCPFYDRCAVNEDEIPHVMFGEIEKGGESDAE